MLPCPIGIAPPFSCYSHGALVPANARWLHVSGHVGVMPEDPARQIELA
ncbi:hypothetical protein [Caballeronia sp. INDeC2]|nr:hypothetical protein [Caballeronia sp. INDeC2]